MAMAATVPNYWNRNSSPRYSTDGNSDGLLGLVWTKCAVGLLLAEAC